jgi:hypothetical protein
MNGVYGTVKPARIKASDVEIFYSHSPSRAVNNDEFSNFKQLDSNLLVASNASTNNGQIQILDGLYNLRLPLSVFQEKGIYTIYIKPKEIKAQIKDVSVLAAYPDVKGIIISKPDHLDDESLWTNGKLVGYRVEYLGDEGKYDYTRIITSNNLCEGTLQSPTNSTEKSTRYRFTDNGTEKLMFCTLTPSTSNGFKPNTLPFIGNVDQTIYLVNTKFSPIMLEIEMVDHDIETLTYMLEGDQLRNLDKGLLTYFNDEKEIYQQFETFELKDTLGNPLYHVKQKKNDITASEDIRTITE